MIDIQRLHPKVQGDSPCAFEQDLLALDIMKLCMLQERQRNPVNVQTGLSVVFNVYQKPPVNPFNKLQLAAEGKIVDMSLLYLISNNTLRLIQTEKERNLVPSITPPLIIISDYIILEREMLLCNASCTEGKGRCVLQRFHAGGFRALRSALNTRVFASYLIRIHYAYDT